VISQHYPGWNLGEIRKLTVRERNFWMAMIEWKKNRTKSVG
jgi:hypothetical protein